MGSVGNPYEPPQGDPVEPPSDDSSGLEVVDVVAGLVIALAFAAAAYVGLGGGSGFGKNAAGIVLATIGGVVILGVAGIIGYRELVVRMPRPHVTALLCGTAVIALGVAAVVLASE